ncbi:MAG: SDR family NAD(P)-dependent oxidoreductase, partial [Rhodobiaceae bacterium]|nr:SDR family NAD(P)-dependent oxidoreductase [Rhodobiaceae bacterium]
MKNLFDIKGKVAVITGGSRGIGEMIANGFVQNGAKVYITARKADPCNATAERLSEYGTCISLPYDLSTLEGVEGFAKEISDREEKLDILVNNAGASWGEPIDVFSEQGWDKVMDINVKGPFFLTQKLLPLLRAAATPEAKARIINIASINGLNPPSLETYSYSTSKAGMVMLTRHLASRL